jgi:RimJ/RimL family protein N-acetyltransferase
MAQTLRRESPNASGMEDMKILPDCWETDRLLVRDATMGDVPYLVNMFDACSYLGEWDNSYYDETEEAFIQLVSKSAGYNHHSKDIFKMQCVTPIVGDSLIGYYHLFHDSPLPRKVWVSMFVVHPHFQKMHYGTELAYGILKQIKQLNDYEAIWIKSAAPSALAPSICC